MLNYTGYTDAELADLLKEDDPAALTEIHSRYYGLLYTHAYKRFPYREEVRDILQELFIYVWDHRKELQLTTGLPAYLYAAIRNRLLKLHRHQKIRGQYASSLQAFAEKGENTIYDQVHEKELLQMIELEIASLPAQMRLIFELSRNEDLSHNEIAERLNLSPHTVRTQVRNALRVLRKKLGTNIFFLFF